MGKFCRKVKKNSFKVNGISAERMVELYNAAKECVRIAHQSPVGGVFKIDGDKLGIKTKEEANFFWDCLCKLDNVKTVYDGVVKKTA